MLTSIMQKAKSISESIPEISNLPTPSLVHETEKEINTYSGSYQNGKTMKLKGRYAVLADWLSHQQEAEITLSFEQVEGIIGSPLPLSARTFRAWWANNTVGHSHSILWLEAGWRVESVDLSEEWVRFARYK